MNQRPERRGIPWLQLALVCVALSACFRPTTVSQAPGLGLSSEEARAIFVEMSRVIALDDGGADFACTQDFEDVRAQTPFESLSPADQRAVQTELARRGVAFGQRPLPMIYGLRGGGVGTYRGPRAIMTATDFNTVDRQPGFVKVVTGLFRCGNSTSMVSFNGCTRVGGFDSMIVIDRASPRDAAITWAHEYGHAVGLNHVSDRSRVMFGTFNRTKRSVRLEECIAYSSPTDFDGPGGTVFGRTLPESPAVSPPLARRPPGMSAQDFARMTYEHGFAYSIRADFDATDVPPLLRLLQDPGESEHHDKVLALLGLIGGPGMADVLAEHVEGMRSGLLTWDRANELTSALLGLGALAHDERDLQVVRRLRDWAEPRVWNAEDEELRRHVQITSMMAMAMSGLPWAGQELRRMGAPNGDAILAARMGDVSELFESVRANGLPAAMGDRR